VKGAPLIGVAFSPSVGEARETGRYRGEEENDKRREREPQSDAELRGCTPRRIMVDMPLYSAKKAEIDDESNERNTPCNNCYNRRENEAEATRTKCDDKREERQARSNGVKYESTSNIPQ